MKSRILLISLSLLLLSWQKVCAQLAPADDFFNSGAQLYISNNVPAALEQVEEGLKTYPDNVKLQKLEKLLKQKQKSQSQQNQQKQNQQQSQKQKSKSQQQKQQKQQQQQNAKKQEQQKKQQEQKQASGEKKNEPKPEKKKDQEQPLKPGQMTPEEAKRLLDAQKDDEQVLQFKPKRKPQDENQPVKDW